MAGKAEGTLAGLWEVPRWPTLNRPDGLPAMDFDILQNLQRQEREGFRAGSYDEEGQWLPTWGILGSGVYITCKWRTALWFGPVLLKASIKPGTRILDVSEPPDPHVLSYLRREFGRDILRQPPWKVLPQNKKLTLGEVVTLVRYHYGRSYAWTTPTGPRGSRSEPKHAKLLESLRSILIRYGYDGYGDPQNDIGIVILSPDRLIVEEVAATMSEGDWSKHAGDGFGRFGSLEALQRWSSGREKALQAVTVPGLLAS